VNDRSISFAAGCALLRALGGRNPERRYGSRARERGFDPETLGDALADCRFVFVIDWRAGLDEELEFITDALAGLGTDLRYELDADGDRGWIATDTSREEVEYYPDRSDLDDLFRALQQVVPPDLEFRAAPDNKSCDTGIYAVLRRSDWNRLEETVPTELAQLFAPIPGGDPT
jgi:hypothetical protein